MILIDLIFAVIVALLISLLLAGVMGWRHPRTAGAGPAMLFLFLLLLVVVWAGGAWSRPYGPPMWGGYWLPYLVIGLFVALVLLAIGAAGATETKSRPLPRTAAQAEPTATDAEEEAVAVGLAGIFTVFFWVLLILGVLAIILRYIA